MRSARWMREGNADPHDLRTASAALAVAQEARAAPIVLWAQDASSHAYVLIVPKLLAPGRRARWLAWALSPAIATYRQFGLPAYLDEQDVWLHGRKVARGEVEAIGECAVVASSFAFGCTAARRPPAARELEDAFRTRIEAQHDWQFETAWPSAAEAAAIAEARLEPAGPAVTR